MKDRKQMSWQGWFYAVQRMDLLLISISGAGVYVILETLKYSKTTTLENLWVIKVSGLLFIVAITVNFLSQYTGKEANAYDIRMCQAKIDGGENPTPEQITVIKLLDSKAERFSKQTELLNRISLIVMFCGLFALTLFFMIGF